MAAGAATQPHKATGSHAACIAPAEPPTPSAGGNGHTHSPPPGRSVIHVGIRSSEWLLQNPETHAPHSHRYRAARRHAEAPPCHSFQQLWQDSPQLLWGTPSQPPEGFTQGPGVSPSQRRLSHVQHSHTTDTTRTRRSRVSRLPPGSHPALPDSHTCCQSQVLGDLTDWVTFAGSASQPVPAVNIPP